MKDGEVGDGGKSVLVHRVKCELGCISIDLRKDVDLLHRIHWLGLFVLSYRRPLIKALTFGYPPSSRSPCSQRYASLGNKLVRLLIGPHSTLILKPSFASPRSVS